LSNNYLTPKETSDSLILTGQNKAMMTTEKRILMSIMAGIYIALGAHGYMVAHSIPFLKAAIFPVGLMLIVIVGGELFTGNCLMTFALIQKKITARDYLKTLVQVFIGNFIGSLIIVGMLYFSGIYKNPDLSEAIVSASHSKLSLTFIEAFTKGILCNILVSLGVWFATTAKDTTGKLLGCWFPVMLFVFCGYEHCVANMFILPMGAIFDHSITFGQIFFNNLVPVTLGNFVGGGILIPIIYSRIYYPRS
jgi:formate/nitrite transporter